MDKFLVTVWHQRGGRVISKERWGGESFNDALIIASYEFCKEIISAECKQNAGKAKSERVNMDYAKKVKSRITITKEIDPRFKIKGQSPKVLRTFGNEMIKIPKY